MSWLSGTRSWLQQLVCREEADERMEEEIRFHLEMETEKNLQKGMSPVEARRRALISFGAMESHRAELRDGRRIAWLEGWGRDVSHAFRTLRRTPGFAMAAVLTIGLGIGASTAIFSVVDAVLLRPLPYPDEDRLVTIQLEVNAPTADRAPFSDRGFWHFHHGNRSFEHFGGFWTGQFPLVGNGEPIQVTAAAMTVGAFHAVGVTPQRGRFPSPEEDVPNGPNLALISSALWLERYGGEPGIVGRSINLNGQDFEVIGVMPVGYDFPSPGIDVWYPFRLDPASTNFGGHHIEAVARLRDGISLEAAGADLSRLVGSLDEAGYGQEWLNEIFTGSADVRTIREGVVGDSRRPLYIVLGAVGFVLLIACGNVANLLLVRAEARSRETAMRLALGANRWRLVQHVFLECLAIAILGGLLGFLLAYGGTRILVALGPAAIPRLDEIHTSTYVLLFTSAVVVGAALLVALVPAVRVAAGRSIHALRDGGRSATVGRDRHRVRKALVISQVALTLVVLVGSGLMVRSFQQLRAVDPGFRPERIATFGLFPPPSRYPDSESTARFLDRLLEQLESLPGVLSVGGIDILPLTVGGSLLVTVVDGFPVAPGAFPPAFPARRVTPGYFETMGIPLVEGRTFEQRDHDQQLGSAIISASFKEAFWPGSSALNRRLLPAGSAASIVGVVGDVHDANLTSPPEQILYLPMLDGAGGGVRAMNIAVRTSSDPSSVMPLIRQEIARMDPMLPITDVRMMSRIVDESMSRVTFTMSLLVLAALVSLVLGAVGIFGLVSYIVAQRTTEIGIRHALGATHWSVWGLVMRQAMAMATTGVLLGVIAAAGMGRSLSSLVYGIQPFDWPVFVGGAVVFLLVAAAAASIPAYRAARVQPIRALRQE